MVIPVLRSHLRRNEHTYGYHGSSKQCLDRFGRFNSLNKRCYSGNAETYPYTESVEAACVCIVTLTGLVGGLIEIYHDSETGEEEKQESDGE